MFWKRGYSISRVIVHVRCYVLVRLLPVQLYLHSVTCPINTALFSSRWSSDTEVCMYFAYIVLQTSIPCQRIQFKL